MKTIMTKINDCKQNLQFLKREQIKIMENEEELSRKETDLLSEKNKKLESLLQVRKKKNTIKMILNNKHTWKLNQSK